MHLRSLRSKVRHKIASPPEQLRADVPKRFIVAGIAVGLCLAGPAPWAGASDAPPGLSPSGAVLSPAPLDTLRPVLVGRKELAAARRRLALQLHHMARETEVPGSWLDSDELVSATALGDVHVVFAVDLPGRNLLVSTGMMRSWGMDLERLHRRALANLDAEGGLPIKRVEKLPWLYVIDADDGYAASRVLLHWRWRELAIELGSPVILGMPTREVVVFTASREPEKLEQLRETVETVERYQGHPVSAQLFEWTPRGWRGFDLDRPLQKPDQRRDQE